MGLRLVTQSIKPDDILAVVNVLEEDVSGAISIPIDPSAAAIANEDLGLLNVFAIFFGGINIFIVDKFSIASDTFGWPSISDTEYHEPVDILTFGSSIYGSHELAEIPTSQNSGDGFSSPSVLRFLFGVCIFFINFLGYPPVGVCFFVKMFISVQNISTLLAL